MGTAIIINRHKTICSNDSNVSFGKKKKLNPIGMKYWNPIRII